MNLQTLAGQPSWILHSSSVDAAVTRLGGQLGPVGFRLGKRTVRPFHVAPWAEEDVWKFPAILRALRGDFFCMPFGGNATAWRGEKHPAHGETANAQWKLVEATGEGGTQTLHLRLDTTIRKGRVDKFVELREGQTALYCRHVISGASGPMNLGHHAMLEFAKGESGRVSTSALAFGQVYPGQFEDPAAGGYSSLKAGAKFRSLEKVPMANGGSADLSTYPAREGYEDLVMVCAKPGGDFAWSAVVFSSGYVWFSLKDPRVLASTVMWHSNGGRHYAPWSSRHRRVLAMEEVTSHFHDGLAESAAKNELNAKGIPTVVTLHPKKPTTVSVIMGVAEVPKGFERVSRIERSAEGIVIFGEGQRSVKVALDIGFLYSVY